jgi:hypothetical protein
MDNDNSTDGNYIFYWADGEGAMIDDTNKLVSGTISVIGRLVIILMFVWIVAFLADILCA